MSNYVPVPGRSSSSPKISPEDSGLFFLLLSSGFDLGGGVGESLGVFSIESFRPGRSSSESKLISSLLGFAFLTETND